MSDSDSPSQVDSARNQASGAVDASASASGEGTTRPAAERAASSREARRGPIVLKVEYKRLNTFFYDYTKNISKGGTFIKTDRPLGIGTVFLFRLTVPITAELIELRGEVRWVVRPGEPPPADVPPDHDPGMGIRFVYSDAEERQRLERTVEQMMVNSLGQLAYSRLFGQEAEGGGG